MFNCDNDDVHIIFNKKRFKMLNRDKKPTEPLLAERATITSGWRHLDDNFETKSKSGVGSYKSGASRSSSQGGYSSRRMKKHQEYKRAEAEYHSQISNAIKCAKIAQLVLAVIATCWLTWWSLLIFPSLFFILHNFTESDL